MLAGASEVPLDEVTARARALDDEFEALRILRDSPIQHSPFMPRLPDQIGAGRWVDSGSKMEGRCD